MKKINGHFVVALLGVSHLELPSEWLTAEPIEDVAYELTQEDHKAYLIAILLADRSQLVALVYAEGARLGRIEPSKGIEELFVGEPPAEEYRERIDEAWRHLLATLTQARGVLTSGD